MPAVFHQAWLILAARGRIRAKLRLVGPNAPTVDVLITCCKEDVDVILDTARAVSISESLTIDILIYEGLCRRLSAGQVSRGCSR